MPYQIQKHHFKCKNFFKQIILKLLYKCRNCINIKIIIIWNNILQKLNEKIIIIIKFHKMSKIKEVKIKLKLMQKILNYKIILL